MAAKKAAINGTVAALDALDGAKAAAASSVYTKLNFTALAGASPKWNATKVMGSGKMVG